MANFAALCNAHHVFSTIYTKSMGGGRMSAPGTLISELRHLLKSLKKLCFLVFSEMQKMFPSKKKILTLFCNTFH